MYKRQVYNCTHDVVKTFLIFIFHFKIKGAIIKDRDRNICIGQPYPKEVHMFLAIFMAAIILLVIIVAVVVSSTVASSVVTAAVIEEEEE